MTHTESTYGWKNKQTNCGIQIDGRITTGQIRIKQAAPTIVANEPTCKRCQKHEARLAAK